MIEFCARREEARTLSTERAGCWGVVHPWTEVRAAPVCGVGLPEMAAMRGGIPAVCGEWRLVVIGQALGDESCGRGRALVVQRTVRRGQGVGLPEMAAMRGGISAVCGEWPLLMGQALGARVAAVGSR